MSNSNNVSPLQELILDIKRFKSWVTHNGSIKSNKSKIASSIYTKAIDAYRCLDTYLVRFMSIQDNDKNEDQDDDNDDSVSFDDFMTSDCGWAHYSLFANEIERRYKQIEEFEPHLLTSPASSNNKNKTTHSGNNQHKIGKKKKKKKKSKAHGGAIGHGGNNACDYPYGLAQLSLTENDDDDDDDDAGDDDDDDDDDEDVNDDDGDVDPFTVQYAQIQSNRTKRLNRGNHINDIMCFMLQIFLQTNCDSLEVHLAYVRVLFRNKLLNIHDIKNINTLDYDLAGNVVFLLRVYYTWVSLNYRGAKKARYMNDYVSLKHQLIEIYSDSVSNAGLCRALVSVVNVGTRPSIFKGKLLLRWKAASTDPRYVLNEIKIYVKFGFVCENYHTMNNCTDKNCPLPHICKNCGIKHIGVFCPQCKLNDKNKFNLRGNITYNDNKSRGGYSNRRGPRGGYRGRGNRRGGGGYKGRYHNNNNNNNNNNSMPQPNQISQFKTAMDAFFSAANNSNANPQPNSS